MKTTKANYAKHVAAIKIGDMPATLQTSHKTVRKNTEGYKDWSAFSNGSGPDYLDLYFAKFDAWREPARKATATAKKAEGRKAADVVARYTQNGIRKRNQTPGAIPTTQRLENVLDRRETRTQRIQAKRVDAAEAKRGPQVMEKSEAPKTAKPRKVTPRKAGATKSRAKTTRSTANKKASNERSLIKVKDADTLKGLNLLKERDRLAKKIHQRSKTKTVREVPVYGVSIGTAKKQAYNALKATKDGKVKNVKIKTSRTKKK